MKEENQKEKGFFAKVKSLGNAVLDNTVHRFETVSEKSFLKDSMDFTLFSGKDDDEGTEIKAVKNKAGKKLEFWNKPNLKNGFFLVDEQDFIYHITDLVVEKKRFEIKDRFKDYDITVVDYELKDKSDAPQIINNFITNNTNSTINIFDSVINGNVSIDITVENSIHQLTKLIENSEVSDKLIGLVEEIKELVDKKIPTPPGKLERFAKFMSSQMFNIIGQILAAIAVKGSG